MSSYRVCGYCGDEGHDRRTCPSLTSEYKSLAETYKDDSRRYVQSKYEKLYTNRTGLDLDGNFVGKPKRARRASTKRCSWCRSTNHNKRTCPTRAEWLEGKNRDNEAYRFTIQERAKSLKIGVGSLLSEYRWYWSTDKDGEKRYNRHSVLGLIEKIDWDRINCDNRILADVITVNWVNCPTDDNNASRGMGRREKCKLLASLVRPDHQWNAWDIDVVGHSDNPTAGMPENWTTKKAKFEEPEYR